MNKLYQKQWLRMIYYCASLLVSLILLLFALTLGWFTQSRNATADGITLHVDGYDIRVVKINGSDVEYNRQSWIDVPLGDIFAGQANQKTLTVQVKNNDARDFYLSWFFFAPDASRQEEVPIQNDGMYYYLGSQLQIARISVNGAAVTAAGEGKYLVATPLTGSPPVPATGLPHEAAVMPRLDIVGDVLIQGGETVTLSIAFVFVDNGENQNIYQNGFTGSCRRRLAFDVKEAN